MKNYLVNKLVYCESAGRILKPGEVRAFDDAAAMILIDRGIVERWAGDAPRRAFAPRVADLELDKLMDKDL